jgi:hypothetical protein
MEAGDPAQNWAGESIAQNCRRRSCYPRDTLDSESHLFALGIQTNESSATILPKSALDLETRTVKLAELPHKSRRRF